MKGKGPKRATSVRAAPRCHNRPANDNAAPNGLACRHDACGKHIAGDHLVGHVYGWARTPIACSPGCADAISKRLSAQKPFPVKVIRWMWKAVLRAAV